MGHERIIQEGEAQILAAKPVVAVHRHSILKRKFWKSAEMAQELKNHKAMGTDTRIQSK